MEAFSYKYYIIMLSLEYCAFLSVNVEDRKLRKRNESVQLILNFLRELKV